MLFFLLFDWSLLFFGKDQQNTNETAFCFVAIRGTESIRFSNFTDFLVLLISRGRAGPNSRCAPRDIAAVETLFEEYAEPLNFGTCFQDFDNEEEIFSGASALTSDGLLLARVDLEPDGAVDLRPLVGESDTCKMKRLYARSEKRCLTVTVLNEVCTELSCYAP